MSGKIQVHSVEPGLVHQIQGALVGGIWADMKIVAGTAGMPAEPSRHRVRNQNRQILKRSCCKIKSIQKKIHYLRHPQYISQYNQVRHPHLRLPHCVR